MFFKNILKTKKTKKKSFCFNGFKNKILEGVSGVSYNFFAKHGALRNGIGFSAPILPVSQTGEMVREVLVGDVPKCELWHHRNFNAETNQWNDKVFWSTSEGDIGYLDVFGYNQTGVDLQTGFSSLPSAVTFTANDQDCILFSTNSGLLKFSQGSTTTTEAVLPKFVDICNVHGRLWGIVEGRQNKILFSENNDPSTWTVNEDFVELNDELGGCNRLVFFEDELYAFRDYGISKIAEYSAARELIVYNNFSTKSKIYGKTALKCGEKILFFARDGLYSFSGQTAKKVLPNLGGFLESVSNENACACFDGKYYILACRLNFGDGEIVGAEGFEGGFTNNAILIYDPITEDSAIMRGVDVRCLLCVNTENLCKVFATFFGEYAAKIGVLDFSGEVFGVSLPKVWKSKFFDFESPESIKSFRKVVFDAPKDCILTIKTDLDQQSFVVVGKRSLQEVSAFVRGRRVRLEFVATQNAEIYAPKLFFEEVGK